jgi:glucose-1-phosphate adenylyltransferase
VEAGSQIKDSLVMGADYYQSSHQREAGVQTGRIPVGIGAASTICQTIVDKNARIGSHVQIINKDNVQEADREDLGFYIRSGVVVVLKNATIPDHTVI